MQFFGFVTAGLLGLIALVTGATAVGITWFLITRDSDVIEFVTRLAESPEQSLPLMVSYLVWYGLSSLCGLSFALWLLLATRNVRSWGTAVRKAPGWAFGAWFIPVVCLWWPKQMVDDAWRGSHPAVPAGTPIHLVPKPGLSLAWWATWLLPSVLINIGTTQAMWPIYSYLLEAQREGGVALAPTFDLVQAIDTIAIWSLWAYVLWTTCALTAAALVVQITLWQRTRLRSNP